MNISARRTEAAKRRENAFGRGRVPRVVWISYDARAAAACRRQLLVENDRRITKRSGPTPTIAAASMPLSCENGRTSTVLATRATARTNDTAEQRTSSKNDRG